MNYKVLFSPGTLLDYHVGELAIFSKILNEDLKIDKNKIFFTDWKKIWNDVGLLEIEKWRIDYGLTHLLTESDFLDIFF